MSLRSKSALLVGSALALLCLAAFQVPAPAAWQKPFQPPLAGGPLTSIALHPAEGTKFLIASGQQVFEAGDNNAWRPLGPPPGTGAPIVQLATFSFLPEAVFVIAGQSIFLGDLKTCSWRQVYKDRDREPLALAIRPDRPNHWFLGTRKGLLETTTAGKTWSPSGISSGPASVPLVRFFGKDLFYATENVLYLLPSGGSAAQQVFALTGASPEMTESSMETTAEAVPSPFKVHDLVLSKNTSRFFLATSDGVFLSLDGGHRWDALSKSGLQSSDILQLAFSEKTALLYAATARGVYAYDLHGQKWSCLFQGLARSRTQSIAILNEEKVLAITGDGFVQYPLESFTPETGSAITLYQPPEKALALLRELLDREPSVREVQKRVIRYANVANGKIKRWHAESRLAGFLPTFSFGKNLDRSASITTYSGKYITGPEDVSKGWDADVSWDLGDMIYSSDQTSIDSREKLMVELRNDLLAEATRIYYERRRLQIDLVYTPPASEQEHLENLLRIDELTALLDGMTDGFFLKQLEKLYREKPAFNGLWEFKRTDNAGASSLGTWDSKQNEKEQA